MNKLKTHFTIIGPALAIFVIVVAVGAPFFDVPLNRDQGVYATCADVLRRGGLPYADCWDTKGPAQHITYGLAFTLFGEWTGAPYALNAITMGLTSVALALLVSALIPTHRLIAYGVGMVYGLLAVAVRYDMNAQPEGYANLFAVLGLLGIVYAARREDDSWRWLAAGAGALLAVTVFYKYALVMPYGVAALALIIGLEGHSPAQRLYLFAWVLGGALAFAGGVGLILLALGALDDALLHARFIFLYFPRAQLNPDEFALRSQPIAQTLAYGARLPAIYIAALAGCLVWIWQKRWQGLVVLVPIIGGVAAVWLQQRFTPYHWTVVLPFAALGIGLLLDWLWRVQRTRIAGLLAVGLLLNTAVFYYVEQWQLLGPYLYGGQTQEAFFSSQGVWDHKVAADYIRERTTPDDTLWVWGHHTAIYHLAERPTPTRFIYNEPLLMRIRGGHPWREAWRADALDDVLADPPTYLLLTTFDRTYFDFMNPNESWAEIDAYRQLTDDHYVLEYTFGRFEFYRLLPYWDRRNTPDNLDAVLEADLLAAFDDAQVTTTADPPIQQRTYDVFGIELPVIQILPGDSITYRLTLPEDAACLAADLSMFPDSWAWGGDGTDYIVAVNGEEAFRYTVTNAPDDQRWHPVVADLSPWASQLVDLTLTVGPGPTGDFVGDWAGWGLPRVVTPPAGQPCDTNHILYDLTAAELSDRRR